MFLYRLIDKLNLEDNVVMDFGVVFFKGGDCLLNGIDSTFSNNQSCSLIFRYRLIDKLDKQPCTLILQCRL